MFNNILYATDLSEGSLVARDMVHALCAPPSTRKLTVLHVLPHAQVHTTAGEQLLSNVAEEMSFQQAMAEASAALNQHLAPLVAAGVDFKTMIEESRERPADTILLIAKEQQSDLIVIGPHSRRGFLDVLMGSTADAVARHAPCPVLVASHPQKTS